mmetsp:Transcript_106016/g.295928  ORF Transcript_106016/g.295928 Transcript_106016/m.295928 type:complete len:278 (-) Transcript_106016:319-1152(-)
MPEHAPSVAFSGVSDGEVEWPWWLLLEQLRDALRWSSFTVVAPATLANARYDFSAAAALDARFESRNVFCSTMPAGAPAAAAAAELALASDGTAVCENKGAATRRTSPPPSSAGGARWLTSPWRSASEHAAAGCAAMASAEPACADPASADPACTDPARAVAPSGAPCAAAVVGAEGAWLSSTMELVSLSSSPFSSASSAHAQSTPRRSRRKRSSSSSPRSSRRWPACAGARASPSSSGPSACPQVASSSACPSPFACATAAAALPRCMFPNADFMK